MREAEQKESHQQFSDTLPQNTRTSARAATCAARGYVRARGPATSLVVVFHWSAVSNGDILLEEWLEVVAVVAVVVVCQ